MRSVRFDVRAVATENLKTYGTLPTLLRLLLADRFSMRAHTEQRVLDVFVLTSRGRIASLVPA